MKTYTSVEEYLHDVPADKLMALEKLRKTIRSVVPKAEEYISYGMPTFKYNGPLVSYAAFKEHCSLFPWNSTLIKEYADELKDYKTAKGTIQFTVDKPLPVALVKKLIKVRVKENEERMLARKSKTPVKKKSVKPADPEAVAAFMKKLRHPLKAEMEAVRIIIKNANSKIAERIKWAAPSYYYKEDFVTFNPRATQHIHLVFHHSYIEKIRSGILEGEYKGRRMTYFTDMADIRAKKKELQRIINELIKFIDNKTK